MHELASLGRRAPQTAQLAPEADDLVEQVI
jgi:hypothetical protein